MSSLATLIVMAAAVGAEAAEQPNPLHECAEDLVGTWVTEWTAPEDVPGLGVKKGQKSRVETRIDWAVQQTVLEWEARAAGTGIWAKGIAGLHPVEKQITGYWFGVDGAAGQYTTRKEGNTWIEKGKVVRRDGKDRSAEVRIKIEDKDTHIRHTIVEGDPESRTTWKRKKDANE